MHADRGVIARENFATLLLSLTLLLATAIPTPSANQCGWSLGQAESALQAWQETVNGGGSRRGFHSDLEGRDAISDRVSYRELIGFWGAPGNENDPARTLPMCALYTFLEELNEHPGEDGREASLIDTIFESARSEMLLGNEDLIEVLDQEHIGAHDLGNPIAAFNPISEEMQLLEGRRIPPMLELQRTKPILNDPVYGHYPQGRGNCIGHYAEAVNLFLTGLSTEAGLAAFTAQNFTALDELGDKAIRAMGLLVRASAHKVRAYKELADRQYARDYKQGNLTSAKNTALIAAQAAYLEAMVIAAVMPEAGLGRLQDSKEFPLIGGSLVDLERVHDNISRGLNPFGYAREYVDFKFDPVIAHQPNQRNHYEQRNSSVSESLNTAGDIIAAARGEKILMRDRVREIEKDYNQFQLMVQNQSNQESGIRAQLRIELAGLLGYGSSVDGLDNDQDGKIDDDGGDIDNPSENIEPDLLFYLIFDQEVATKKNGEIHVLVSELKQANLQIDRLNQEIDNIDETIEIRLNLLENLLKINDKQIRERTGIFSNITSQEVKIIRDTGEEMANLAKQEAEIRRRASLRRGIGNILSNLAKVVSGAIFDRKSLIDGVTNLGVSISDTIFDTRDEKNLGNINIRRERVAALEKAKLVIKGSEKEIRLSELEARIYDDRTNAEFEAEIKSLLLQQELLTLDLQILAESVNQQTLRLNTALKRAQRILADKAEFEARVADTDLLKIFYQDPSARILEDDLILRAAKEFRRAAEELYLVGKAMEYETNEEYPRLHDIFQMRTVKELVELKGDIFDEYTRRLPEILNPALNTREISLRQDLLGLSLAPGGDTAFRNFLTQHLTSDGNLSIRFATYLTVGKFDDPLLPLLNFFGQPSVRFRDHFPQDHWNEKIQSIAVNINNIQNTGITGVDVSLDQSNTSFIRSRRATIDAQEKTLIKDDVQPWYLTPRSTGTFGASVNEQRVSGVNYFTDQLALRSVASAEWHLFIQGRGIMNIADLLAISDIEIIINSVSYPLQRGQ